MSRTLRPPAAFATVALIGVISAGCGSSAPSETRTASSSGTASATRTASTTSRTRAKGDQNATDEDKIASPRSPGSLPAAGSPRHLPGLAPRSPGSLPSPASPTHAPRMQQ